MKFIFNILFILILFFPGGVSAKLKILTTTTTLKSIVEAVGGDYVKVESITKGSQDPHFVEAKPSYMLKARDADLILAVGLELEIGWLPNIIRGARNPKILRGNSGYLETGTLIQPIEILQGKTDRSQGDLHSLGNPHFALDPVRVIEVAKGISKKLSELDAPNKTYYSKNVENFSKKINLRLAEWTQRIQRTGIKHVITYHKTLNYFLSRFNLELSGSIEPKAGIPPTAKHILGLIKKIKNENISCILVESFFETNIAERIKKSVPIHIEIVPSEVNATKNAVDIESLIESLVASIEKCKTKQIN